MRYDKDKPLMKDYSLTTHAEAVMNSLALPVIVVDNGTMIMDVNDAAEEFLLSGKKLLLNKPMESFLPSDSPVFDMLKRARASEASVNDQGIEFTTARTGTHLVNLHISPLIGKAGFMVLVIQARAAAEKLRDQAQIRSASSSISSFSSMLAHEIKNPLAGIRGAAELLMSEGGDRAGRDKLVKLIVTETDRVTTLLNRMENLARGQPIAHDEVNIHEIIDHCLSLAAASFGDSHRFEKQFDPSLPETMGDRDLLIQALINLIKNACEASDKKSLIKIITAYNIGEKLAMTTDNTPIKPMLTISVIDAGAGVVEAIKSRLFDPFVTTKKSGTGLGLAMVAGVASDHGGSVDYTRRRGETAFHFNLPIVKA